MEKRSGRLTKKSEWHLLSRCDIIDGCHSFNLGQVSKGSTMCIGALVAQDVIHMEDTWLLGDTYVHRDCFKFDAKTVW